jgi:hypothetical protein
MFFEAHLLIIIILVIGISLSLSQSDPINRLPLYWLILLLCNLTSKVKKIIIRREVIRASVEMLITKLATPYSQPYYSNSIRKVVFNKKEKIVLHKTIYFILQISDFFFKF